MAAPYGRVVQGIFGCAGLGPVRQPVRPAHQLALVSGIFRSEDDTMPKTHQDDSNSIDLSLENEKISTPDVSDQGNTGSNFIPFNSEDSCCVVGYRSGATPGELLDEATLRLNAVIGALHALSGSTNLNELNGGTLGQCFEAILILCSDAKALHAAAYNRKPSGSTELDYS